MMNLNKRYRRNIRHNMSFYLCASLLTALSVLFVITAYTAVDAIDRTFLTLMNEGQVEDAQFSTLLPISESEQSALEKEFDLNLEKISYVDLEEKDYRVRVFLQTRKINRVQIVSGSAISSAGDILLNPDFAAAHDIAPGDSLTIDGKDYIMSGTAARPDYLYAQKNPSDFYVDDYGFGQVTMNQEAFDQLANQQSYYVVDYHQDNSVAFRKHIFQSFTTMRYLPSETNNRIDVCREIGKEYGLMMAALLPIVFGMNTLIVAVVLGRKIRREKRQIGTLLALGYRNIEVTKHYIIYAMIPGIVGSVTGVAASVFLASPLVSMFALDYESVNFMIQPHWASLALCLFCPVGLYILTAVFSVQRLIQKNVIVLLAGTSTEAKKRGRILSESKLSFRQKFRLRSLLSHKGRTAVILLGLFFSSLLCSVGFVFADSWRNIVTNGMDSAGSYEYQYVLNTLNAETKGGEKVLMSSFEAGENHEVFTLNGLSEHPKYISMEIKSGEKWKQGRYYMTTNAAELFGIKAGDIFVFTNLVSAESYQVEIEDLILDNTQCALYTSLEEAEKLLELPEGSYNLLLSDKPLDINKSLVVEERTKAEIKEQLTFGIELLMNMIYLIIFAGVLLCVVSVYLTVNMLIEENRSNISMLKVLGYHTREINRIVLNTNHILVPICLIAGIFTCVGLSALLFRSFLDVFNLYIEPVITPVSIMIIFAIQTLSYSFSLLLLKRKAYRVNMADSLKDNRE